MKCFQYTIILVQLLLIFSNVKSQSNLVVNGSFENFTSCPNDHGQVEFTSNWTEPDAYNRYIPSPDYFNSCGTENWTVPNNISGFQEAHSGHAYAGLYTYGGGVREFIQSKLSQELIEGCYYKVEFYISCSESSQVAADGFGMYISNDTFDYVFNPDNPKNPQIFAKSGTPISDTESWTKVSGIYLAKGGENYITLGNFKPDSLCKIEVLGDTTRQDLAYYYVDDISIRDTIMDKEICLGDTAFIQSCNKNVTAWANQSSPNEIISTESTLSVSPPQTTTYLMLTELDTTFITVKVIPPPEVQLGDSVTFCKGNQVQLNASTNRATYLWQDGSTDSILIVSEPGIYWVVVNRCGTRRDSVTVVVEDCSIYVPNVFTPNNDDINDKFIAVPTSSNLQIEEMRIYDRWGSLIYVSREDIAWDGTSKGVNVAQGVYVYFINYQSQRVLKQKTGTITLLR